MRKILRVFLPAAGVLAGLLCVATEGWSQSNAIPRPTLKEQLGKAIFFDAALSEPRGQSCAACHDPDHGYNGNGNPNMVVFPGAVSTRKGSRNPPSAAYAFGSPAPGYRQIDGDWVYLGGQFWDGRADGLAEQAKAPFLNPNEMNNRDADQVVRKVCAANYRELFFVVFGPSVCFPGQTAKAYQAIGEAIAAFERSAEVNPFSSRYDAFLAGKGQLTPLERKGLALFEGKGGCARCHPSGANSPFTDFTYDNIGIPRNPAIEAAVDLGLGARLGGREDGRFKVSTLRNVAVAPPYGHNGFFKTLKEIVHFYNTRDTDPAWPAPEVSANLNRVEVGHLGLTDDEENAIVAFLGSLTDRGRGPR